MSNKYLYVNDCLYWYGLGIGMAEGHYGCPKVNTLAIPLQATINVLINWLLELTLIPGFCQAIMGFIRPLWIH